MIGEKLRTGVERHIAGIDAVVVCSFQLIEERSAHDGDPAGILEEVRMSLQLADGHRHVDLVRRDSA